jgi:hypothetical protein
MPGCSSAIAVTAAATSMLHSIDGMAEGSYANVLRALGIADQRAYRDYPAD